MGSTRILCVFVVLFALMRGGSAQDDLFLEQGTAGLHQSLKRLQTTASVLHVVAHPDDEDGALMCYCARGLGARAMLFCITRGEGGANLISSHFFDELGLLRTLEHLKAAQYYGSELFYSSAADYGYSKNLDEARRMWSDGRTILAELVEVIRREQPTIIMSRFRGDARDGHGHHQMSGVLSQEAFSAAADPRMFPDQLARGLTTWQAEKLYANNIRPQWREEDRDAWTVAVPTGQYDPVLGRSYAQIARFGLGFQRSQGISGHTSDAGQSTSYYRLVQVAADRTIPTREQSLFDNLDTTIRAIGKLPGHTRPEELTAALTSIELHVQQAHDTFDLEQPENTIESLALALQETNALLDRIPALEMSSQQRALVQAHLIRKRNELNEAVALSAGVDLAAWATDDANDGAEGFNFATPGQRLVAHARVVVRNRVPARLLEISWQTAAGWTVQQPESPAADLNDNEALETQVQMQVDTAASATRPYWQRPSIREPFYSISGGEHRHRPLPPWPLHCVAKLTVNGTPVEVRRVVESRIGHTEFGNVRYAVQVVPPISLAFPLPYGIVPRDREQYTADVLVRSAVTGVAEGTLRLELPDGWSSEPVSHQFAFGKAGEETQFAFVLHRDRGAPAETTIQAVAEWNGKDYREGFVTVTARDLERANLFRPAVHQLRTVDVQLAGAPHVGYITGSGDDVASALQMLGVRPVILSTADLAAGDLSRYDVILVGVRAYAVREDIRTYNARLLKYVHDGGVLIVQYQTPEFDNNFGPYPYQMGRRPEEVSEEDSLVTILAPEHPAMSRPNQITAQDFEGWVEQRGSKFLTTWSDEYIPVLECHDTGQPPQRGGLLVARHGQGVYVYAAYAWYRQLPHGVPGAFRIMANLLSLPETK